MPDGLLLRHAQGNPDRKSNAPDNSCVWQSNAHLPSARRGERCLNHVRSGRPDEGFDVRAVPGPQSALIMNCTNRRVECRQTTRAESITQSGYLPGITSVRKRYSDYVVSGRLSSCVRIALL
jgi:hypothetical protein